MIGGVHEVIGATCTKNSSEMCLRLCSIVSYVSTLIFPA